MLKHRSTSGYSIVELIVAITVIGILSSLVFVGVTDSQARARDTERTTDIDTLHSRLEEHYTDNGGYPATLSTTVFPGMDPAALEDPSGDSVDIRTPVDTQADAMTSPDPDGSGADYAYIPYPTGCSGLTCRGYVLKSFIENPTADITNPYVRGGLHNN